jgi:hypothetical protein
MFNLEKINYVVKLVLATSFSKQKKFQIIKIRRVILLMLYHLGYLDGLYTFTVVLLLQMV